MIFKCLLAVLLVSVVSAARLPGPQERIVGGNRTYIENAPYQVAILQYGVQICGGAIYSERIVLTAAHCLNGTNAKPFSVRAGSNFPNFGGQVVAVQKAYPHEDYNNKTLSNDIAVLYLKAPLKLNTPRMQSIELTEKNPECGSTCFVTGWGDTYFGSNLGSPILYRATLKISNYNYCRLKYTEDVSEDVTEDMICASAPGQGPCHKDSGGPLVSWPDFKLIGIVSWGRKCAKPDFPGVYASVYYFRDWIRKTTSEIQKPFP